MISDFLQSWLQRPAFPWWGIVLTYLAFAILLDALLCLIFGGRERLREFGSDPVHWYWLVFVGCGIPALYLLNWQVTTGAISLLGQNAVDISTWRYHFLVRADRWLQWFVLILSAGFTALDVRRYAVVRTDRTFFSRLPWSIQLFRSLVGGGVLLTYAACMTVINLIDSTVALDRVFVHIPSAVVVDAWHPDGLYGLKPAYELLLTQFGVALVTSFLPLLMLRREAKQSYRWTYGVTVLSAVLVIMVLASIVLYNFNSAIERVRLSTMTATVNSLRTPQVRQIQLLREVRRTNLLVEYQIAASLSSSLPVPGWLKALGTSRVIVLAVEFYSLLQPVLGIPKVPDILRRVIESN